MISLFVILPVLAFITIILLVVSLAAPKETTVQGRLKAYRYATSRQPGGDLSLPFTRRVILPFVNGIVRLALKLTPGGIVSGSQRRLNQARSSMAVGTFLLVRLISALVLPALSLLPAMASQRPFTIRDWAVALLFFYFGYKLPDIWLTRKIEARQAQITQALPDSLDLIVVCVEAGYSLEAALAKVVEKTTGPLSEEFGQALAEVSLGRTRREALKDLSDRCASSDLQTFIAAVLQADSMGVSIADALRVQADAMRVRRRQRAEEMIAKAPVKMLFPMAGFIFPALFVVLLGPSAIKIFAMFASMAK